MKDFFTPMKIPQKWVCLLAMSFVFGQQAFSSENYDGKYSCFGRYYAAEK